MPVGHRVGSKLPGYRSSEFVACLELFGVTVNSGSTAAQQHVLRSYIAKHGPRRGELAETKPGLLCVREARC